MRCSDSRQRGDNIISYNVGAKIPPSNQHDFMRKIVLHLSLKPFQQVKMPAHGNSFLNDTKVALKMI
jgi:hypothetical protein